MSATPSSARDHAPAGAPSTQAPSQVPAQMPTCMPLRRRTSGPSADHGRSCHRLVMSEGMTSKAAASAGAISIASRAIDTVGSPRPTMPLTPPATRKMVTAPNSQAQELTPSRPAIMAAAPPAGRGM